MVLPDCPNQRRPFDFVSDSLIGGRRYLIPCVVDDHARERLPMVTDTSLSSARVALELASRASRSQWSVTMASNRHRYIALVAGAAGRMALHRVRQADA